LTGDTTGGIKRGSRYLALVKKSLPMMGVRIFRDQFPTLTEPVQVIRSTRKGERPQEILGTWTPVRRPEKLEAKNGSE
jgi:hypothetical protein